MGIAQNGAAAGPSTSPTVGPAAGSVAGSGGRTGRTPAKLPGLIVALVVAAVATGLGHLLPVVGGPVFGIILGAVAAAVLPWLRAPSLSPGYGVAAKPVLQASIVVLGTGLSLQQVARVGLQSLPVMLGTLTVALGGAWLLGRLLDVRGDTQLLIGVGTGICGASAIAATTAVVGAAKEKVAYAIGTIFTFNIAAVLLFPPLGHLMGLSAHSFGLWSGTAINDTSSVVAASFAYGHDAGTYGIVVKLTRTLMLIPIVIALALWKARRAQLAAGGAAVNTTGNAAASMRLPWRRIVPAFLIGFVLAAALDSVGLIPAGWHPTLSLIGTFLITTALAGIGLSMRLDEVRKAGHRPLLLGGMLWVAVGLSSLGLQALTGQL